MRHICKNFFCFFSGGEDALEFGRILLFWALLCHGLDLSDGSD
jgi:hypothetical protein